jgi:antitoxin VapB
MALSIRNSKVEKLARELSDRSGLGLTEAIGEALEARLDVYAEREGNCLSKLSAIAVACAAAPDLDTRGADEILGYDESGAFGERQ